jgi:hypothetical protein
MLAGTGLVDVKDDKKKIIEWMMTNQGTCSNGLDIVVTGK